MTQYIVFLILAPVAAVASAGALVASTVHGRRTRSPILRAFLCSQLLFLVGNTLELVLPGGAETLAFAKGNYLFIASGPVLWFLFAMEYAGFRSWLRPVSAAFVSLIPGLTFLFALFDGSLHLIWRDYGFEPVFGMLVMRVREYGPWLWVHFGYCYLLMILGGFAIFARYVQSHAFYRKQSALILLGVLVPLAFNFIYLFHLVPGLTKDFSPVSFGLGGVCFAVGILRFRLATASPVSRRELIDGLSDGFLVVDGEDRILDVNASAAAFFGSGGDRLIGTDVKALLPSWRTECRPGEAETRRRCVAEILAGGVRRASDLTVGVVPAPRGGVAGYQAVFRLDARQDSPAVEDAGSGEEEPFPFLDVDAEGRILSGALLADLLDYSEEKLSGRRASEVMMERLPFESGTLEGTVPLTLLRRTGEAVRVKARLERRGPATRLTVLDMRIPRDAFSVRENQVIDLLAQGLKNKEIGDRLFVSENTVKAHLKAMYRKAGTGRRTQFLHRVLGDP